jgi:hypothetical protein
MLLQKNWLEIRLRLAICAFLVLVFVGMRVWTLPAVEKNAIQHGRQIPTIGPFETKAAPGSPEYRDQRAWRFTLDLFAGIVLPIIALILAGSGLHSQSAQGMSRGFHPSVYFTLALPVSRKRIFWSRTLLGLAITFVLIVIAVAAFAGSSAISDLPLSWEVGWKVLPFLLIGTFVAYSVSTVLTVVADEFWGGVVGMAAVGFFFGLSAGSRTSLFVGFMQGRAFFATGEVPWVSTFFYINLSAALLFVAHWSIERREY